VGEEGSEGVEVSIKNEPTVGSSICPILKSSFIGITVDLSVRFGQRSPSNREHFKIQGRNGPLVAFRGTPGATCCNCQIQKNSASNPVVQFNLAVKPTEYSLGDCGGDFLVSLVAIYFSHFDFCGR